jgi:predicted N-acetyltransferase YhbS
MDKAFLVEQTKASDETQIETLLDISFGIDRRLKTSYRLREGNVAAEDLSLVVRDAGVGIAGAVSFWPLAIGTAGTPALLLGPLVVNPARQNLGVGLALMNEGLRRAKAAGHQLVVLVGDAPYYGRVGFQVLPEGRLIMPGPVDPKRFLYLELAEGSLAKAEGLVLPPHRFREISAAFAGPHETNRKQ